MQSLHECFLDICIFLALKQSSIKSFSLLQSRSFSPHPYPRWNQYHNCGVVIPSVARLIPSQNRIIAGYVELFMDAGPSRSFPGAKVKSRIDPMPFLAHFVIPAKAGIHKIGLLKQLPRLIPYMPHSPTEIIMRIARFGIDWLTSEWIYSQIV